jgi:predicted CXXCH cytochrome family protein
MTTTNIAFQQGGGKTVKKALFLAVIALAAMTLMAGTAFAEGYNDGGWNFTTGADESGYGDNAGIYVRDPLGADQELSAQGPHGGYAVSTNKCQDCHSTHYALGSFVLMRSDSREDACTFCHQGGGGSTVNIMMDNEYDANGVVTTSTTGFGTGHTLGYKGSAPADIKPAFTEPDWPASAVTRRTGTPRALWPRRPTRVPQSISSRTCWA